MKSVVYITIFLFLSFLSLPTIVGILDKQNGDISIVYNLSEEEEVHKSFSLKEFLKTNKQSFLIHFMSPKTNKSTFESQIQYDSILEEIFSPPPEV